MFEELMQRFILPRMASCPPLPSPPGSRVARREEKSFRWKHERKKTTERIALLPYGVRTYVRTYPSPPPSSPLLEKARPFSVEQGETWQKRGGRRSAYAKRAYPPSLSAERGVFLSFLGAPRSPSSYIRARPFSGDFSEERASPNAV